MSKSKSEIAPKNYFEKLEMLSDPQESPRFFNNLARVMAYDNFLTLVDKGMYKFQEVRRYPQYRLDMLMYFIENYRTLLTKASNSELVPRDNLPNKQDFRNWQSAGYKTRRNKGNYEERLHIWKAIYDERAVYIPNKEGINSTRGKKVKGGSMLMLGRVRDDDGNLVTYRSVIERRDRNYGGIGTKGVPYWSMFNYGMDKGYPTIQGGFFLERAEQALPEFYERAMNLYEQFAVEVLDHGIWPKIGKAADFVNKRIKRKSKYLDLPIVELARYL